MDYNPNLCNKITEYSYKTHHRYSFSLYLTLYLHLFPKFSNALTKLESQVSIQGISLMNMAFFGKRVCLAYNDPFGKSQVLPIELLLRDTTLSA